MKKIKSTLSWGAAIFALIFWFFQWPAYVFAAPSISGVSGTVLNGQSISISGSGFGSGPNIDFFDDFEKGSSGSIISTAAGSAQVNNWSQVNPSPYHPKYSTNYSHSGTKCMLADQSNGDGGHWALRIFGSGTNRAYISYWIFLPTNSQVPGSGESGGPNWKIGDISAGTPFNYGSNWTAGVTLTDPPSGSFQAPNPWHDTDGLPVLGYTSTNWAKGRWQRFELLYVGGSSNNGSIQTWEVNSGNARLQRVNAQNITTLHSHELWNWFRIHSYARQDSLGQCYYDDVYMATGPNAFARVEIGNNSTYSNCTNLATITPTSWSSNSISATVRQGAFASGSPAYLFVIDSAGAVSPGFPVIFGTGTTPPPTCTLRLNSTSASVDSLAHTGSIGIIASSSSCSWTAVSNASWITITSGASGTGSDTVGYSVSQNTSTSQRTGTITVAGQTFTVTQSAGGTAACTFTLTPGSVTLSSQAQTGSISVGSSTSSCSWTAVSNSAWISVSPGSSGTRTGSGTVQYSVTQNTSTSSRTGTMTIAGKTVTVQQAAGSGMSCAFSLDKNIASFDYLAQTGNISVTASASTCTRTTVSNASWITITSGNSGTGSGTITFSIALNTSQQQRIGTITVGGITFTVYQAAYNHKKPHPPRNLRTAS